MKNRLRIVHLGIAPEFKPGDPRPSGYVAFQEWAGVQTKAGLKQRRCWGCGLWRFPQEECCGPKPAEALRWIRSAGSMWHAQADGAETECGFRFKARNLYVEPNPVIGSRCLKCLDSVAPARPARGAEEGADG